MNADIHNIIFMSRIVTLTEAASLAIHAMVLIAQTDHQINVNFIAEQTGASRNHLAKVMQRLVKDGLVKSTRGPLGGFKLAKKPEEISILTIYEAIEGSIKVDGCPFDRPICPFHLCLMGNIISKVTIDIRQYFEEQTLDKFING